jgi:hypothetical protein
VSGPSTPAGFGRSWDDIRKDYPIDTQLRHPVTGALFKVDGYKETPHVILQIVHPGDSASAEYYRGQKFTVWHIENVARALERVESKVDEYAGPPELEDLTDLNWVGIDLDETLAVGIWPTPGIGPPIMRNVEKARRLASAGYKIHVHTSRAWHEYREVKQWLHHNGVPHHGIQMGKPLYAAYIDDRAIFAGDADWTPKTSEARRAEPA